MRSIEEILDEVCWNHGYINFQGLQDNLKYPTATGHKELFRIIEETAKSYSREAEKHYEVNEKLEDEIERLEEEVDDLEYEIDILQDRVKELEDELNELRED